MEREIRQAGYDSAKSMLVAYEEAKKTEEKLHWIKFRFEGLSVEEQKLLLNNNFD